MDGRLLHMLNPQLASLNRQLQIFPPPSSTVYFAPLDALKFLAHIAQLLLLFPTFRSWLTPFKKKKFPQTFGITLLRTREEKGRGGKEMF